MNVVLSDRRPQNRHALARADLFEDVNHRQPEEDFLVFVQDGEQFFSRARSKSGWVYAAVDPRNLATGQRNRWNAGYNVSFRR